MGLDGTGWVELTLSGVDWRAGTPDRERIFQLENPGGWLEVTIPL